MNVDSSYHRQYREQTTASVASQPTVNSWSMKSLNLSSLREFLDYGNYILHVVVNECGCCQPTFMKLDKMTNANKLMDPQHFQSNPGDIQIWI